MSKHYLSPVYTHILEAFLTLSLTNTSLPVRVFSGTVIFRGFSRFLMRWRVNRAAKLRERGGGGGRIAPCFGC